MQVIMDKILIKKVAALIIKYGEDVRELVIDFPLNEGDFHTIELIDKDIILMHCFDEDFDSIYLFDDLSEDDRLRVYQILKAI